MEKGICGVLGLRGFGSYRIFILFYNLFVVEVGTESRVLVLVLKVIVFLFVEWYL